MELYKPYKGFAVVYILFLALIMNVVTLSLVDFIDSYIVVTLIKTAVVFMNIYFIYYCLISLTVRYLLDDCSLTITFFWGLRKIRINLKDVEGYEVMEGRIRGVKLTGIGNDSFAFGRTVIEKVGTTRMFVTSNKRVVYIKSKNIAYGISPIDTEKFETALIGKGVSKGVALYKLNKNVNLYKEKIFIIPFLLVAATVVIMTLNPLMLYLSHKLPERMPLSFDSTFAVLLEGSAKQFVFKQMTYGVLNMIILLCMYYASHFSAKYDKKSAIKYIYIALITAVVFLIVQIRILTVFG
jgi:hypothetical protein